jgi:hypothetical protein
MNDLTSAPRATLWRLLADYERLTQDESVALRSHDFACLEAIQECKRALVKGLCDLAKAMGGLDDEPFFRERWSAVLEKQSANAYLAAALLRELEEQRRELEATGGQVRGVARTYAAPQGSGGGLAVSV